MKQGVTAEKILDKVLNCSKQRKHTSEGNYFFIIPGQFGPRWLLPSKPPAGALDVLKQWTPYNFTSKLKWHALLLLYRFGHLGLVPKIKQINGSITSVLHVPQTDLFGIPLIYVGTPGKQQKAVATIIEPNKGTPLAVLKVALEKKAIESLQREAMILKEITKFKVPYIPTIISTDKDENYTWQTMVRGCLSSTKLTRKHIDWLLSLPVTGATTFYKQREELKQRLAKPNDMRKVDINLLASAIDNITGNEVPLLLVHGDFTPWNLKILPNGCLGAIDWENGQLQGLPLWDLCHFHFMQAHLFKKNPLKSLINNYLTNFYLDKLTVSSDNKISLILIYLVKNIVSGYRSGVSNDYKKYLLGQLAKVLAV